MRTTGTGGPAEGGREKKTGPSLTTREGNNQQFRFTFTVHYTGLTVYAAKNFYMKKTGHFLLNIALVKHTIYTCRFRRKYHNIIRQSTTKLIRTLRKCF